MLTQEFTPNAVTPTLDEALVASLQERFSGELLRPADAGYEAARSIWNAMIDRRPALIARCTSAGDVAAAVSAARDARLPVAVYGGGHG